MIFLDFLLVFYFCCVRRMEDGVKVLTEQPFITFGEPPSPFPFFCIGCHFFFSSKTLLKRSSISLAFDSTVYLLAIKRASLPRRSILPSSRSLEISSERQTASRRSART